MSNATQWICGLDSVLACPCIRDATIRKQDFTGRKVQLSTLDQVLAYPVEQGGACQCPSQQKQSWKSKIC